MTDSVDKLASMTGLSRHTLLELWADAKANNDRLVSCPRHSWTPVGLGLRVKYTCRVCGGTVDSHAYHWYELGMKHAR